MSYNGWTNRETWLVNLWVGDNLSEMKQDGVDVDARYAEQYVVDLLDVGNNTVEDRFMWDLVSCALSKVNWHELVSHLD
jgi:hypothetical protein